jgi:lipopolysaccharide export LptBFGC system permease protein LptF
VANVGLCTLLMATVFGMAQSLRFVSQSGLLSTELASWLPLMLTAGLAAWMSPMIKT